MVPVRPVLYVGLDKKSNKQKAGIPFNAGSSCENHWHNKFDNKLMCWPTLPTFKMIFASLPSQGYKIMLRLWHGLPPPFSFRKVTSFTNLSLQRRLAEGDTVQPSECLQCESNEVQTTGVFLERMVEFVQFAFRDDTFEWH